MSYFLAIPGQLCNISGPLRDDDFTIDLTQGEIFSVFFYDIFRDNSNKNLHFHRINISLSMYNETAAKKL